MILDPSAEAVALRRRKLEALLRPQHGTFLFFGGGSGDDLPPCPLATDPRSPDDPKQVFSLNKRERTSPDVASQPTEKQKAWGLALPPVLRQLADHTPATLFWGGVVTHEG